MCIEKEKKKKKKQKCQVENLETRKNIMGIIWIIV